MTTKEYLDQAYWIDQRINSKIEQITSLRELATKATGTLSDMPRGMSPNLQPIETIITKIVDLEAEINYDIDGLVDLKQDIISVIKTVENPEQQTVLEQRYLCAKTFEQIAEQMNYSERQVRRLHEDAIDCIQIFKDVRKCP